MTTPTDPKTLIAKAREVCKAATPGPWKSLHYNGIANEAQLVGLAPSLPGHMPQSAHMQKQDADFCATARTLVPALAQELEACLQYKAQLTLTLNQHRDTQQRLRTARTELADHKAKMVDLLAHAYEKGRRFSEDTDDRTSEHG